jgi:ABC-type uncharacterized transport system permease subunit
MRIFRDLTVWERVGIAGLFGVIVLIFLSGCCYPPNNWDSMTYHMARIAHWVMNESIEPYPTHIYSFFGKILLMTVFPAGLIATLPMAILHQHRIWAVIALPLAALLWVRLAKWVFQRGLRRYVSGNEIFA